MNPLKVNAKYQKGTFNLRNEDLACGRAGSIAWWKERPESEGATVKQRDRSTNQCPTKMQSAPDLHQ